MLDADGEPVRATAIRIQDGGDHAQNSLGTCVCSTEVFAAFLMLSGVHSRPI